MTLIKSNSFLPSVFDDFFSPKFLSNLAYQKDGLIDETVVFPPVNVIEKDSYFELEIIAPGMEKEDFDVELNDGVLIISSQGKVSESKSEENAFTYQEFTYQTFQRSFQLPDSLVDDTRINAKYEKGILKIILPKKEEAIPLPPRQIAVG